MNLWVHLEKQEVKQDNLAWPCQHHCKYMNICFCNGFWLVYICSNVNDNDTDSNCDNDNDDDDNGDAKIMVIDNDHDINNGNNHKDDSDINNMGSENDGDSNNKRLFSHVFSV